MAMNNEQAQEIESVLADLTTIGAMIAVVEKTPDIELVNKTGAAILLAVSTIAEAIGGKAMRQNVGLDAMNAFDQMFPEMN